MTDPYAEVVYEEGERVLATLDPPSHGTYPGTVERILAEPLPSGRSIGVKLDEPPGLYTQFRLLYFGTWQLQKQWPTGEEST